MNELLQRSAFVPSLDIDALEARYRERKATIGIIGLGYVGLPLARAMTDAGLRVIGFDVAEDKVEALKQGRSYIKHISDDVIEGALQTGRFDATTDFARAAEADALIICVPTPLSRHREPDLDYVVKTTVAIAEQLRAGQLVVLESTTYPGTTAQVMRPILEKRGLQSGRDFFLAYSPEREDPGNIDFSTSGIPKVVGGDGEAALRLATALYDQIVVKTVPVASIETAEAVKLTENIFRAINIALVNELKVVFGAMGIDVWDVIEAAKTKPFGFMPFYPGPGLGGHCIPIDPFYLTWKAREFEICTRFIELAGEVNTAMPRYVVERLAEALDRKTGQGLTGARVLIMGLAYKKNIDDMRESPSLKLIELLERRGATVGYYDPHIPTMPKTRDHPNLADRKSVRFDAETLGQYDVVLIATDHDDVDYDALVRQSRLVIDTRNVIARNGIVAANVIKA